MDMKSIESRIEELEKAARRRKLDLALVLGQANILALTGVNCDNAVLAVAPGARGDRPRVALVTSCPASRSLSTMGIPKNLVPPITRMFILPSPYCVVPDSGEIIPRKADPG